MANNCNKCWNKQKQINNKSQEHYEIQVANKKLKQSMEKWLYCTICYLSGCWHLQFPREQGTFWVLKMGLLTAK